MSTKREEVKNEKIIRGLMKLPPNRRCINCNSLGPQYVCVNFWTFICMTCSGIHREFTHRVKSVSMSKFTSQEVDALQNGGNQRAKEIFLKRWDQRERFPSSNNIEKIRDFIKHVYVDRKYAGGRSSEKPPRDMQSHRRTDDETRRASSYHSYSQSPPYDFQYEDRKNRKQGVMLSRKPGSDHGVYEGNVLGLYSPGRFSDHIYAERFAMERSSSRVSDYSVSSDPFRSYPQSPNSLKEVGFSSPTFNSSQEKSFDDSQHQATKTQTERTVSSASLGSFDSSTSLSPANSGSFFNAFPQLDQSAMVHQNVVSSYDSQPSAFVNSGSVDLFKEQQGKHLVNSAPSIDLFQTAVMPSVDHFQSASAATSVSSQSASFSSLSFFNEASQSSSVTNSNLSVSLSTNNGGWATFDSPQHTTSVPESRDAAAVTKHFGSGNPVERLNSFPTLEVNTNLPEFQGSVSHRQPSVVSSPWHQNPHNAQAPASASSSQVWKAFEDTTELLPSEAVKNLQFPLDMPSTADHYLGTVNTEDSIKARHKDTDSLDGVFAPTSSLHAISVSPFDQSPIPFMGEMQPNVERKSVNPFDIPYDIAPNSSNRFFHMSSLEAARPNMQLPSSFIGGINESWFPPDATNPCILAVPQGGMPYITAQAPSPQLSNVQTNGPVASVGGNPFT